MIHVAELLREDVLASKEILEEYPLDLESTQSIERSKQLLIKITLATLHTNDDTEQSSYYKPFSLSGRPELN